MQCLKSSENNVWRVCEWCGTPFPRPYTYMVHKCAGRYCSRLCYLADVQRPFGYYPSETGSPHQITEGYRNLACAILRMAVHDHDLLFLRSFEGIALAEELGISPDVWLERCSQ